VRENYCSALISHPTFDRRSAVFAGKHLFKNYFLMKKTLFLLFVLTAVSACKKNDNCTPSPDNIEYLIFGHSSCFCFECCKTGYKIAGTELYKGEKDNQGAYVFETAPQDAAKYATAKKLLDELPNELLAENGKTWGCAGCADQPVYYVELKKGGTVYHWIIDSQTDGFPDYVKSYSAKLGDILNQLQ